MNFVIDIGNVEALLEHYTRWLRHLEASRAELQAKLARLAVGKKAPLDAGVPGDDQGLAPIVSDAATETGTVLTTEGVEAGAMQAGEEAQTEFAAMQVADANTVDVTAKGREDPWL